MNNSNKKYKIELFNRNTPDSDFLKDLKSIAEKLKKNSLSTVEYDKYGKYHSSTIRNRFEGWNTALKSAGLEIRKHNLLSRDELIRDLEKVSKLLKKNSITQSEYLSVGLFSIQPFIREFGNWFNALNSAKLKKTRNYKITKEQYFKNLERVWTVLGRQPRYSEMQKPLSEYSRGAYDRRFGNWTNTLKEFEKFVNASDEILQDNSNGLENNDNTIKEIIINPYKHKTPRNINWRLRFRILERDNFMCVKCGRKPPEIKLHVDHKKAYSIGGETIPENLETLCEICNVGKSNL